MLFAHGLPYEKRDNECAHPSCNNFVDFQRHDKPPPGWATVSFTRFTQRSYQHVTLLVCPKCTIAFATRQPLIAPNRRKLTKVVIESPFAASTPEQKELHKRYLRAAMLDCFARGEAPFASHHFYTDVLDDDDPEQRRLGVDAGLLWASEGAKVGLYTDLGVTEGMQEGAARAKDAGKIIEIRSLPGFGTRNIEHE